MHLNSKSSKAYINGFMLLGQKCCREIFPFLVYYTSEQINMRVNIPRAFQAHQNKWNFAHNLHWLSFFFFISSKKFANEAKIKRIANC